jgi:hypothetical protein
MTFNASPTVIMLSVTMKSIMLSVIMPTVVMLNVVAPFYDLCQIVFFGRKIFFGEIFFRYR